MAAGKLQRVVLVKKKKRRNVRFQRTRKSLFGNTFKTTMKYYSQAMIDPAAATLGTWVFRANDLVDPDYSFTGHQPRGYDQLSPLYDHWVVLGSKITVKMGHTNAEPQVYTLALKDTNTLEATSEDYIEGRYCKYTITPQEKTSQMSMTYNAKSFFSIKNPQDERELHGQIATKPTEVAWYHISVGEPSGTNPAASTVTVLIEYFVQFTEPTQPIGS